MALDVLDKDDAAAAREEDDDAAFGATDAADDAVLLASDDDCCSSDDALDDEDPGWKEVGELADDVALEAMENDAEDSAADVLDMEEEELPQEGINPGMTPVLDTDVSSAPKSVFSTL